MKKFLTASLLFILGLAIINTALYFFVKPHINDTEYVNRVQMIPKHTRGIILADSHGLRLDETRLQAGGFANISASSDSYEDMLNKLKYVTREHAIEEVVISVDRHCLSKYRETMNNADQSILLAQSNSFMLNVRRRLPLIDPRSRDLVNGILIEKASSILDRGKKRRAKSDQLENWKKNGQKDKAANERAETQFPNNEASPLLTAKLLEICAFCAEKRIRLSAVRFPVSKDYLRVIDGKDYGAADVIKSVGVTVRDYERIYTENDEMFANPDHLNADGAARFTRILLDDL